jgi:hypothetical protein
MLMPSKSKSQHNLMAAAAHNPAFAKKVGIPMSVAKDYSEADKGKKFGKGGTTSDKARINRQNTRHGKIDMPFASLNKYAGLAKGGDVAESKSMVKKEAKFFQKKGGKELARHEFAEAEGKEKDTPARSKQEIAFMKRNKAPAAMLKHEMSENDEGYARGGRIPKVKFPSMSKSKSKSAGSDISMKAARSVAPAVSGIPGMGAIAPSSPPETRMNPGGGVESKGKAAVKTVKMNRGGGIEAKGKTKGRMC